MHSKKTLEVILPIFNEKQNLPILIQELDKAKAKLGDRADVRFLFINDGSVDGSKEILDTLFRARRDIRVVHLVHNFGHAAALACGIATFRGDIAVIMDADLQDSPDALVDMFDAWEKGAMTVVAERASRTERTRLFFDLFYKILHKMAPNLPPIKFGTHCLLDASVVARLRQYTERNRYLPGLVSLASGKILALPVDRQSRKHGKSQVGVYGLINLAITAIVSFSSRPVRLVSIFGLCASAFSLAFGLCIMGIKVFSSYAIPGWASMMTLSAFGTGVQLLCIGIIGEYVARIYEETKQRPLYLVDEILELSQNQHAKQPRQVA
jgi:polyisoprenyl-phosphate glycosyltransferase